jgi:hypothetical protein
MVQDHAHLRECFQQVRDQVGIGGRDVEPDDVILLGRMLPDTVGSEFLYPYGCKRVSRAADCRQSETDNPGLVG